ncbi:MAG: beta-propeller fold lactonase family protein [Candidatus Sulfobium sp.]
MSRKIFTAVLVVVITLISAAAALAKSPLANDVAGAVYTMTNSDTNNEVVFFDRDSKGILTNARSISTQGTGSGGGLDQLASQGAVVLSEDHRWLLVVNAGSNEVSVFRVLPQGLDLVDKVDSGGLLPVSLTVFHDLVYVLNAGTSPNITGFYLSHAGQLLPLEDSTRSLGDGGFSQVKFSPAGTWLVVTDRANNQILVFGVGLDGLPALSPVSSASSGAGPFGVIFDERGHLLVVEVGSNAISSYNILASGALETISPSVGNGQNASCWIAGNRRGDVYSANTGSHNISAYGLAAGNGQVSLVDETAGFGNTPIDMTITVDGRFLYALDPANGGIDTFQIKPGGGLIGLGLADGGLAIFAQGIAAR